MSILDKYVPQQQEVNESGISEIKPGTMLDYKIGLEAYAEYKEMEYAVEQLDNEIIALEQIAKVIEDNDPNAGYELLKINLKALGAGYESLDRIAETIKKASEAFITAIKKLWDNLIRFINKVIEFVVGLFKKNEAGPEKVKELLEKLKNENKTILANNADFSEDVKKDLAKKLFAVYAMYEHIDGTACSNFVSDQADFLHMDVINHFRIKDVSSQAKTIIEAISTSQIVFKPIEIADILFKAVMSQTTLPDVAKKAIKKYYGKEPSRGTAFFTRLNADRMDVYIFECNEQGIKEVLRKLKEYDENLNDVFMSNSILTIRPLTQALTAFANNVKIYTVTIDAVSLKDEVDKAAKTVKPVDYNEAVNINNKYLNLSKEVAKLKKETEEVKKLVFEKTIISKFNFRKGLFEDYRNYYRVLEKIVFTPARKILAGKAQVLAETAKPKINQLILESIKLYESKQPKQLPNK